MRLLLGPDVPGGGCRAPAPLRAVKGDGEVSSDLDGSIAKVWRTLSTLREDEIHAASARNLINIFETGPDLLILRLKFAQIQGCHTVDALGVTLAMVELG